MTGTTLDAGALIALEAGGRRMIALVERALQNGTPIAIPAGVLAQAWRGGARQVRLIRLFRASITEIVPLDHRTAIAIGKLCGQTGAFDVVDVSVVLCARERKHPIVTGDPDDLCVIDPTVTLMPVS
ncbi:MAG: PIN domain-containing protein [Egibacteraceae bacterium]